MPIKIWKSVVYTTFLCFFWLSLFLLMCPLNTFENLQNHCVHNVSVLFLVFVVSFLFLLVCPAVLPQVRKSLCTQRFGGLHSTCQVSISHLAVVKNYARRGFFNIRNSTAQMSDVQTLRAPTFAKNRPHKTSGFETACCEILGAPAPGALARIRLPQNPFVHNVFASFLESATISATPCIID